ncbi:MAG: sulfotransferase [Sterolibacterium sp.]
MTNEFTKRRQEFTPEPRPDWVRRINEEGSCMDIKSLVPLDENSLIETAKANTGLSDFGADDWRERFQILVKAFDEESQLNLLGRLMTRADMLTFLQARLQIEDTYKRHPEIDEEEIHQPIYIVGQGRSGTSFLQYLLSADPNNGTPMKWEIMAPCPPPEKATYLTDPRIAKVRGFADQFKRVSPEIISMHDYSGDIPTESHQVLCLTFGAPGWMSAIYGQAPSFIAYMQKQSMVPIYEYEKRVMKLLQWKNPRKHWVMKSPLCLPDLPEILKVHPDVAFVFTHRDPVKALASMVNLVGAMHWNRSDQPYIDGHDALTNAEVSASLLALPIDWLETGVIPKKQLFNIQYQDLIKAPVQTVAEMYGYFGIEMSEESRQAIQRYLDENPRSSKPPHKYPAFHGDLKMERKAYERYQSYFNVPNEI